MSCVQLPEGCFLGLWSQFSGVVRIWLIKYLHLRVHNMINPKVTTNQP